MAADPLKTTKPNDAETDDPTDTVDPASDAERVGGAGRGAPQKPGERGGPEGPEPTRYGDWETGGRCTDF